MTHFLPARIEWEGREARVTQLPWQGSGDIVALALANGFLIVGPERPEIAPGEWVDVLPRRGAISGFKVAQPSAAAEVCGFCDRNWIGQVIRST